jgi:hypothetical protein
METSEITDNPQRRTRRKHVRRHLTIDGVKWAPREEIAVQMIGVDEKTLRRLQPTTTYISNVAYCPVDETMRHAVTARQRKPTKPKRGGRR